MSTARSVVMVTGFRAVILRRLLEGLTVQTVLEILLTTVKEGTAKKSGNPYKIIEAHCVLRDTDGKAGAVGVLTVPKALEEKAKPGLYTASFALEAPTFGESQGKVVATLKDLIAIQPAQLRPAPGQARSAG